MFMELNFAHNLIKYTIEKKIFTVLDMNHFQVPIELKYHLCDSRVSRIRVMRSCGSSQSPFHKWPPILTPSLS